MKKALFVSILAGSLISFGAACYAEKDVKEGAGEGLFKKHCAVCHPDGGNIVNPKFGLHKKDREANNIAKPGDIVNKMRNPGPGMPAFDKNSIADKDAEAIAAYILETFK